MCECECEARERGGREVEEKRGGRSTEREREEIISTTSNQNQESV